jgi:hypothetical protein
MKKLYTLALIALSSVAGYSQVVISQVYGGGGNSGATYTHDFVELFNSGDEAVTLSGYTLQYASAANPFSESNVQTLPDITIQPGQYFLIQQAQGNGGTTALPSPDLETTEASNVVVLALSGSQGKIVLANNNTLVTSSTDANVVDFVGFGGANMFEGAGAAPQLSNTTAALRASNGCQDTNDNATDFVASEPTPRNTATALNVCSTAAVNNFNDIAGLKMFPNPLTGNVLHISSDANAAKAVAIYDVLGKQVVNTVTANGTVNVQSLTAGIYIVKITEEGKTATRKLVVK